MRHLLPFLQGVAGVGAALGARAGGALLINKLVSVYGGPGGLTQLAQFQSLMGLFGALPADGVHVGVTTYLSPLRPGQARHRLWLAAALWLTTLLVAGSGGVLLLVGGAPWSLGRTVIFTGAMLLITVQALLGVALLAAGKRGAYVALAAGMSVGGLVAVAALLALRQPLSWVLLGYATGQALSAGLSLGLAIKAGLLRGWQKLSWPSWVAVQGLLKFLLTAIGTLLFGRAIDYALRAYLMAHFSPAVTDLWQAVTKLSDSYTVIIAAVLSAVFYPRLAALAAQPAVQRRYVSTVVSLLALGLGLGFGMLYWFRATLLPLLFAPRMAAAAPLLAPQLLGDWAKFISWVLQYTLLVRARALPYLAVQGAGALVYTCLLILLLPTRGLQGLMLAYMLDNGLLLLGGLTWYYGLSTVRR
jgi:PST family polysaccharide transporter